MEIAGQKIEGLNFEKIQKAYQEWLKQQPAPVEVLLTGVMGSLQGLAIGYFLGKFGTPDPSTVNAGTSPALNAQLQALQTGGPWAQARNLGTLTGVQQALSLAIKKARGGTDDVYTAMGASFGGGMAYSLVSGAPNPLQSAVTTGMAFALFNGLFYQLGNWNPFKPEHPDTAYERGKYMLATLGLQKYQENLKKQLLTDNTIMLWNDGALADASIPAGPRLLILHHLDGYRNPASVLKPALPLPPMPPMPPPPQIAQAGAQR